MSRETQEPVEFEDAWCKRETAKALLVFIPDHGEKWIPKSQVHDDSEVYQDGDRGKIVVSAWFAEKEGLG